MPQAYGRRFRFDENEAADRLFAVLPAAHTVFVCNKTTSKEWK